MLGKISKVESPICKFQKSPLSVYRAKDKNVTLNEKKVAVFDLKSALRLTLSKFCYLFYSEERVGSVGRVLDSGSKGHELETHWMYCVVSLIKTLYPLLSTGSIQEVRKSP